MGNQSRIEIILAAVDRGLTTGFNRALGSLKSLVTGAKEADTGVKGLTASVSGLLGPLLATISAAAGMQKLVSVSREFDKLSAGLITATGSIEGSEQAFAAVQDFATRTPYDLAQVTDSFVKLVNFGLDPSERALTSYGNTSSALGKNLNQMIEAVADAATGEFERLKEFGIKASSEGDKVSFTFRGVTTTVGKNAAEIEQYLIKLGETNFGDAMANRMKTLDGALSNLDDEWNKVFLNISKAGIGNLIADGVRTAIGVLEELNAMIASGELEGYLRAIVGQFAGWADDVKASIAIVTSYYHDNLEQIQIDGKDTVVFLIDAFRQFPENVRAFIGLMVVTVAAGLDKVAAYATAFKNGIAAVFNGQTFAGVGADLERELKIIDDARDKSIDSILAERDADLKAHEEKVAAAKKLRAEYDAEQAAAKANTADRLAQFKVQAESSGKSAKEEAKAKREAEKAAKKAAAEAKKAAKEAQKLADIDGQVVAEKLRAASQEKILALELEKINASKLPTALARGEAELAIERKILAERIAIKQQELAAIKADPKTNQAEVIRAESELAELKVNTQVQLNDKLRSLAATRLQDTETAWRRGIASVQDYQAAVTAALQSGAIDQEQANEKLIASGNDLGAALSLGFQKAREKMQTDSEMMIYIGENLGEQLSSGLSSAWDSYITKTSTAKEALIDFARSTLSWLSQIILKQMLLNAIGFGSTTAADGTVTAGTGLLGMIGLASGGSVPGWSPSRTADNIPAWLTAREFVHPVDAVDYYGLPFMELVRRKLFPRNLAHALAGGTLPRIPAGNRLAQGGMAAGPAQTTVKTGDTKLRVINVLDKNMVGDYLRTADGETAIINMIRRNGSAIRTLIGG